MASPHKHPELRLSIESPYDGCLVIVDFLRWEELGGDRCPRVLILPADAHGGPAGTPHEAILTNSDDELAYASYNTRAAFQCTHVVLLQCGHRTRG